MIDIGINLTHDGFAHDRDAVLAAARAVGVTGLIITGTSAAVSREALALARTRPGELWSTAGVHPHHASEWDDAVRTELTRLLAQPEVVAVGECGLDFHRNWLKEHSQQRR